MNFVFHFASLLFYFLNISLYIFCLVTEVFFPFNEAIVETPDENEYILLERKRFYTIYVQTTLPATKSDIQDFLLRLK